MVLSAQGMPVLDYTQRRPSLSNADLDTRGYRKRPQYATGECPGSCMALRPYPKQLKMLRFHQSPEMVSIAKKAERRLHRRFWRLVLRKDRKTAAVAVARELAGFVWAMLQAAA